MQADIQAMFRDIFRVGRVVSTDPATGTVRVQFFDTDDMVSPPLQVLHSKTHKDKTFYMPDIDEDVACIFLGNGPEAGFVLGAVYNEQDKPPVDSQDKCHITFEDGTTLEYDREEHVLTADVQGDVSIKATGKLNAEIEGDTTLKSPNIKLDGDVEVTGNIHVSGNQDIQGNITAQGEVSATPAGTKLSTHIHPTGVGPSGAPVPGS